MAQIIEGRVISKEPNLTAVFEGQEQPYVRVTIARLDRPEVHSEARVVGQSDIPVGVGGTVRLEITRAVTDRKAGVVKFDTKLLDATP